MVKARNDPAVKYTLFNVFLGAIKMLAIFMPHVTEDVYQEHFKAIDGCRSIHLTAWPEVMFIDEEAEKVGEQLAEVLAAIRAWKGEKKVPLNAELAKLELVGTDAACLDAAVADIAETTKAKEVVIAPEADLNEEIVGVKPEFGKLGPAFKGQAKAIVAALNAADMKVIADQLAAGNVVLDVEGEAVELGPEFFKVEKRLMLGGKAVDTIQVGNVLIVIEQ
jgi:valyl-tRNA synthetase